jgi:F-type H+-transporting ATPase subunit b
MQIGIVATLARTTAVAALATGAVALLPEAAFAATEPGAAKGAFPPFDSKTFASQLFWLALTFGGLYWLMAKIALPRIGSVLTERGATLARDLDEAAAAQAKAQDSAKAYEDALAAARARAQGIAQAAREASAKASDDRRKAVEAELAAKAATSDAAIAAAKTQAMGNVRDLGVQVAAAIVAKLTNAEPSAAETAQAVDAVLAR